MRHAAADLGVRLRDGTDDLALVAADIEWRRRIRSQALERFAHEVDNELAMLLIEHRPQRVCIACASLTSPGGAQHQCKR